MSTIPNPPEILDKIVDLVLVHKPKLKKGDRVSSAKTPKERKRNKRNSNKHMGKSC